MHASLRGIFRVRLVVAAGAVLAIALPAGAAGQTDGNSQVDQYSEAAPGAENGGTGQKQLPEAAAQELRGQGADGQAVEGLAEGTSPTGSGEGAGDEESGDAEDDGAAAGVADAAGGSDDGMGFVLPLLIGVVLAGGIAFLVIRRREGQSG